MSCSRRNAYCLLGCIDLGAHMHRFPHPERREEMFKKWVSIVGEKLHYTDPHKIYRNKLICDLHFKPEEKLSRNRLLITAVPCLFMNGVHSSANLTVQLDHNYAIQRLNLREESPSTSTQHSISEALRLRLSCDNNPNPNCQLSMPTIPRTEGEALNLDENELDTDSESHIEWSNLIFLPFHPIFKLVILCCVIVKCILGPIQSVYPVVYCLDVMDDYPFLAILKYFYLYFSDSLYAIDTFLHVVHRQVTDKAMRREYLPKDAFLLLVDIFSLIPFVRIVISEECPPIVLWPNILAFTEFVVIYRVVEYFSLTTSHSFGNLLIGYTLLLMLVVNCTSCFWVLITKDGLCPRCATQRYPFYDWRAHVEYKLHHAHENITTFVYSTAFVLSFAINRLVDDIKPVALTEFIVVSILVTLGHLFTLFVVFPKIFGEAIIRLQKICGYYPMYKKFVAETKRRNPSAKAYKEVDNYFKLMWTKCSGINRIPNALYELPRYLRIEIEEDLLWPIFFHSPLLRRASDSLRRMLCELIVLDYKLPGEKLYSGINAHSRVFYIKSGVVQILSADDGVTALVSASGGTVFGDISFHVPPWRRKTIIRCLTFCEVLYLSRADYVRSLHKYPEDRRVMLDLVKDRLEHAHTLNSCKQNVRGLDRTEDEGIAWIKRRWWEISSAANTFKRRAASKKDVGTYEIPPEKSVYHCAKYIGQLVLCSENQLQTKSLFVNTKFPWILVPRSDFSTIWYRIVTATVFLVLILYPPNITSQKTLPAWFKMFQFWADFVYCADICVSLLTAVSRHESDAASFASVMFTRCKTLYFILDVISALWIEYIAIIIGKSQYYNIVQYNRIIKVYMLFTGANSDLDISQDPIILVCVRLILVEFGYLYINAHILFAIARMEPSITKTYFFGKYSCDNNTVGECEPGNQVFLGIARSYLMEMVYPEVLAVTITDVCLAMVIDYSYHLLFMFCKTLFVAAMYLKMTETVNYQYFVENLKKYYIHYKIHGDLLKRIDRYLICHWKYYRGMDLMRPNMMRDEPYDVYWKVQGAVAEKIIGESTAFKGADPSLIRELAYAGRFLIVPKDATLYMFNVECKSVSWIVQGFMQAEYNDDEGQSLKVSQGPGRLLSASTVFMSHRALKTYKAKTDCEILYMRQQDFLMIIKRYPQEWGYLKNCIDEFEPQFAKVFDDYLEKYEDYSKRLREHVFKEMPVSMDTFARMKLLKKTEQPAHVRMNLTTDVWDDPEAPFMIHWMTFRTIVAALSIVVASLQGGSGANVRYALFLIGALCDCVACVDICIKLFLAYRDKRGVLIHDTRKCIFNYLTKGFVLDIIGALPWYEFLIYVMREYIEDDEQLLCNTACKFAHLYIVFAYFDYLGDTPNVNVGIIRIVKWQSVAFLIMLGSAQYLHYHCISYDFNHGKEGIATRGAYNLRSMTGKDTCWLPPYRKFKKRNLTINELHMLYSESLLLAHAGMLKVDFDRVTIDRENHGIGTMLFLLGVFYWFVTLYSLALLVLNSRGNTLYQHGVNQLRNFLISERVDPGLIAHATAHFTYWWRRTKGINIHQMTNERIGVVLRQDLNYYFYEKTLEVLDTLLLGGETISRQLASASYQVYVLPDQEIIREHDIISHVYVVHRGKVTIYIGKDRIATLTKGCIFGQLEGSHPRPTRISARADEYSDLLQVHIKQFQEFINDQVRATISNNQQSQNDFLATKRPVIENPYDSVQYLIGGHKTMKFPFVIKPIIARQNKWYATYLSIAWLIAPVLSVFISTLWMTFPDSEKHGQFNGQLLPIFIVLDSVHMLNFITEFFAMEMVVIGKTCVSRVIGWRRVKHWQTYIDFLGVILPMGTYIDGEWAFHLLCVLRLRVLQDFYKVFCQGFESKLAPATQKGLLLLLHLHVMACGWIAIACREAEFDLEAVNIKNSIDPDVWLLPTERKGGCRLEIKYVNKTQDNAKPAYVVPRYWQHDYIIAFTHIVMLHVQSSLDSTVAYDLEHIYYKLISNILIYFTDLWVLSIGISFIYTRFRELYQYDFNVRTLKAFLENCIISPVLVNSMTEYSLHLWQRQRGNWLPELAAQAPMCLREDLMSALYMHHLETPTLFKELPPYFRRQLAARLRRIVIFPGKCIIKAGDIFACLYFVHEGEVEKWHVQKNGESKMMSLLSTNGYFGLISGLFPNVAFQYSYISRTVVDLVHLRLQDWEDLLDGYPEVKRNLYNAARQQKKDFGSAYAYVET